MNTRTGELACDVGFPPHPGKVPVALANIYSGAARPDPATIKGWGVPVLLGFEATTTYSYGGAGNVDAAADQLLGAAQAIGYPSGCGFWICAADENSTPAQYLPNIEAHFGRWRERLGPVPITPYGNPDAIYAAARGAGGLINLWGVGTWNGGEGGGPNQPPAQSPFSLLQSGNTPGPAPGTDLDWLYVPVANFAAWGGPAPAPAPEEDMDILVQDRNQPAGTPAYVLFMEHGRGWKRAVSGDEALGGLLGDEAFLGFIKTDPANPGQPYQLAQTEINKFPDWVDAPASGGGHAGPMHIEGTFAGAATPA